ncbi:hypothetical protein METESE_12160 [Mesoterricola sediminis]|uniref:Uncharacterized protein n=1 Tax=Mesoterricola sediminis TaxID=2927980 RepID=A0AA48H5C0_9BACT|nr:hypothetical protein METESE_12160 [Mesoterricola sediminis]
MKSVEIGFLVLDSYHFQSRPRSFKLQVSARRGVFYGFCKVPLYEVPGEVWTMEEAEALEHPFIMGMVENAKRDLAEKVRQALEDVA